MGNDSVTCFGLDPDWARLGMLKRRAGYLAAIGIVLASTILLPALMGGTVTSDDAATPNWLPSTLRATFAVNVTIGGCFLAIAAIVWIVWRIRRADADRAFASCPHRSTCLRPHGPDASDDERVGPARCGARRSAVRPGR
ncbi:hypothetical protein [Longispora fulva]|uniref:Uncharacterized protein n=1 Tax=Longispora fulva TaxID=619741 RepID=A0A8J7KJQ8_9ACTN|nr:hypothetical protein [Longispora fulva]MBG6135726.1 hypothetical protein [Longispora fulva]